jgi:hypothetical protein
MSKRILLNPYWLEYEWKGNEDERKEKREFEEKYRLLEVANNGFKFPAEKDLSDNIKTLIELELDLIEHPWKFKELEEKSKELYGKIKTKPDYDNAKAICDYFTEATKRFKDVLNLKFIITGECCDMKNYYIKALNEVKGHLAEKEKATSKIDFFVELNMVTSDYKEKTLLKQVLDVRYTALADYDIIYCKELQELSKRDFSAVDEKELEDLEKLPCYERADVKGKIEQRLQEIRMATPPCNVDSDRWSNFKLKVKLD